jgi:hypothetical protein
MDHVWAIDILMQRAERAGASGVAAEPERFRGNVT